MVTCTTPPFRAAVRLNSGVRLKHMHRLALYLCCCIAASGYGSSATPVPPDFNEACYGGDFSKSLAGAHPIYSAELDVPDSSWPELKKVLLEAAAKSEVKTFDEGRDTPELKMFSLYMCSKDGLFSIVDKRTWHLSGEDPIGMPYLLISVYAYKKNERWDRFGKSLDATLRSRWPDALRTHSTNDSQLLNSPF